MVDKCHLEVVRLPPVETHLHVAAVTLPPAETHQPEVEEGISQQEEEVSNSSCSRDL